jgi:hypothetical protein
VVFGEWDLRLTVLASHAKDTFVAKRPLKASQTKTGKASHERRIPASQSTSQVNGKAASKGLAKSADPAFTKFTTYIRKTTHLGVKTRLVSKEKELSDLVEELLSNWLKENNSFEA